MTEEDNKSRERTCIVTGETLPENELVRFVLGPEGEIVPDLAARLPGRGLWVKADRAVLESAVKTNAFARAAKMQARPRADLAAQVCELLAKRLSELLGLARRAGLIVSGFSKIEAFIGNPAKAKRVAAVIEASDGSDEGARKLAASFRRAGLTVPVIRLFQARQIGLALGEELVVHAALLDGGLSRGLLNEIGRYRCLALDRATAPESVVSARYPV